ncbi:uncharacterized protein LOC128171843 [Crassostrea angulata]|uniref:uncharacterized protein LOC128171843 n=1 Tax=Magallana angulata TaxID=2784310 RepID=UPI0022B0A72E|nr:uncharacterized protein LOC128171843 [Crassostrea angulata]
MNISGPVSGRYVIYYNTREGNISHIPTYSSEAYIELCEVEVYGWPVLGYKGQFCNEPCPENCQHCHLYSGECLGACNPGFYGNQCKFYNRKNLALNKPTYQSSTYEHSTKSENAVDGLKSDSSTDSGHCSYTALLQPYALWRVDLMQQRYIERITLYPMTSNLNWTESNPNTEKLLGFSLVVSNTTDRNKGVVCYKDTHHTKWTIPASFDIRCPVIGQYVMYYNERLPGSTYPAGYSQHAQFAVCEIEVYGCPIPEFTGLSCNVPCLTICRNYLENLAVLKPTWQSSTKSPTSVSGNAVDNKKTIRTAEGGQCTSTLPSTEASWGVNLGGMHWIDHILIYFRTDDKPWDEHNELRGMPLGFYLYISNTSSTLNAVLCFHEHAHTILTLPDVMNVSCPYYGQYIIYRVERKAGVTYPTSYSEHALADLCEVEVYGCPVPVVEFPQCSRNCPENCEQCYPETGVCKKCHEGYKGMACELVCHAAATITVSPNSAVTGTNNGAIYSAGGLTLPSDGELHVASIYLSLSEQSSDLSYLYMSIVNAVKFSVLFLSDETGYTEFDRAVVGPFRERFTARAKFNSKTHAIRIKVQYKQSLTISDLKLPLRTCYLNTTNSHGLN